MKRKRMERLKPVGVDETSSAFMQDKPGDSTDGEDVVREIEKRRSERSCPRRSFSSGKMETVNNPHA
jgi:hypothetical protein